MFGATSSKGFLILEEQNPLCYNVALAEVASTPKTSSTLFAVLHTAQIWLNLGPYESSYGQVHGGNI